MDCSVGLQFGVFCCCEKLAMGIKMNACTSKLTIKPLVAKEFKWYSICQQLPSFLLLLAHTLSLYRNGRYSSGLSLNYTGP